MAIDSRDKRGSVIGFDAIFKPVFPNPDGAINTNDRQFVATKYHGISSSTVATTRLLAILGVGT